MRRKLKDLLVGVLMFAAAIVILPGINASADELDNLSDYVMFTYDDDESLQLTADNICVNGCLFTNGTAEIEANDLHLNGILTEENGGSGQLTSYDIFDDLYDVLFPSTASKITVLGNYNLYDYTLTLNYNFYVQGNVYINGNTTLNKSLTANGDIRFNGPVINKNDMVLCSKNGDINITTDTTTLNCFVYAPNGTVEIDSTDVNINGIIVAKKIIINSTNLNIDYNYDIAQYLE